MFKWKQLLHIEFLQHAPATVCIEIAVDHKLLMWSSLSDCEINVSNWCSMHASAQWEPALFMRHTIGAHLHVQFFSPSSEIIHSCCSWTAKGFLCCCGAYRIPFLWSKAGIIEVGCSDMRVTTKCSTSCRFSSCREGKGGRKKSLWNTFKLQQKKICQL